MGRAPELRLVRGVLLPASLGDLKHLLQVILLRSIH